MYIYIYIYIHTFGVRICTHIGVLGWLVNREFDHQTWGPHVEIYRDVIGYFQPISYLDKLSRYGGFTINLRDVMGLMVSVAMPSMLERDLVPFMDGTTIFFCEFGPPSSNACWKILVQLGSWLRISGSSQRIVPYMILQWLMYLFQDLIFTQSSWEHRNWDVKVMRLSLKGFLSNHLDAAGWQRMMYLSLQQPAIETRSTVWSISEAGTSLDVSSDFSVTCKPLRLAGTCMDNRPAFFWYIQNDRSWPHDS